MNREMKFFISFWRPVSKSFTVDTIFKTTGSQLNVYETSKL